MDYVPIVQKHELSSVVKMVKTNSMPNPKKFRRLFMCLNSLTLSLSLTLCLVNEPRRLNKRIKVLKNWFQENEEMYYSISPLIGSRIIE